jgi:hypothetical protein
MEEDNINPAKISLAQEKMSGEVHVFLFLTKTT